jgi:hypothetical protein
MLSASFGRAPEPGLKAPRDFSSPEPTDNLLILNAERVRTRAAGCGDTIRRHKWPVANVCLAGSELLTFDFDADLLPTHAQQLSPFVLLFSMVSTRSIGAFALMGASTC